MSNYSSLKATINANVKTNGNQEITGSVLNSVLIAMVDSVGAGYQFMGVATPSSPGTAQTPDYKCFYLASTPGTYTYLGGLVVADGEVAILKYDTAWSKEVTGAASAADLSQLGQKVTPLLDVVETFRTENIFNEDAEITAYPLKILSSNAYDTSNFHFIFPIEINGQQGDIFTMKRFADAPDNILEYFLAAGNTLPAVGGSAVVQGGGNFTYQRSNVTLPSSCQYLFIVVRTTAVYPFPGESAARVMLEKTVIKKAQSASDYPTEYIPYEYQKVVIGSDNIDVNAEDIGAVAIEQGVAEMGKFLGVGADGKVTPIALPDPSATIDDAVVRKETKTLKLSANVLTEASVSLGTGWSGTLAAGISHASGSTDPLSFSINTESGEKYLVSFDLSAAAEKSVLVSIGDSPKVDVYNGQTHIDVGIIADGGQLNITPSDSSLAVTLTNIKLRKVVPESDAVDVVTLTQQNVEAGSMQNNISGFWNVAVGPLSGGPLAAEQNASRNVAIGYASLLRLKAGTRNIAIGTYSMPWVVEGDRNVAIGADTIYDAPEFAAKAYDCIAIGKASMKAGTNLQYNIAIGTSAMAYCNTDTKNTIAIGYLAGNYSNNNNVHIGVRAGYYTKGQGNVSLGYGAMSDLYNTGSNNVCIGFQSGTLNPSSGSGNVVTISNSIAIGANAKTTKSNQCVIGADTVTEFVLGGKKLVFNVDGTISWTAV